MKHHTSKQTPGKIGFISLGCPKALVDSERILTLLQEQGYEIGADYTGADIIIINTCGFIEDAVDESMETIDEALQRNGKVIVTGCLGAKEGLVQEHFPEVLAVTGPHASQEVLQAVHQHLPPAPDPHLHLLPPTGVKLTPAHYAYLKISEGCNHRCRFCIIPALRGDLVSRPIDEVLDEAQRLQQAGVKELLVISQDTSAYGVDLKYRSALWHGQAVRTRLYDLARLLGEMDMWIRLHYVYPYPHIDELIPLMADGRLLPYLDIPLQHASPRILKSMKRPADTENVLQRIHDWRRQCPQLKIRSTFIVGFPGETEDDFEQLLEFLQQAQLDRVGCFQYSPIEGASANALPGAVAEEVKLERQQRFMQTQAEISAARLHALIGQSLTVLVDQVDDQHLVCRSHGEAPGIDGVVVVNMETDTGTAATASKHYAVGDFIEVEVINADEHDLFAKPVGV